MLLASNWPARPERVEHHLQREAQRHADEQLLITTTKPCARERRDGRRRNQRRDQRGDRDGEHERVRGGTKRAPNTGATMRQAPMRDEREESLARPRLRAARW